MQPVKIIKAKNGYILEVAIGDSNKNEHWLFGTLNEAYVVIAKHFDDKEYMNKQMENVNESILSNIE